MGININGTSVDKVVFNGTEVEKVIFNGTVVYTKGTELQYLVTTDSSGNGSFAIRGLPIDNEIDVSVLGDASATWDVIEIENAFTVIIHSSLTSSTVEVVVTVYPLLDWNDVYIPSSNNKLNDVLYDSNNQQFVAVGDSGLVCRSIGSSSWLLSNKVTSYSLKRVTYGNGLYVAVGDNGTILYSSDGYTWSETSVGDTSFTGEFVSVYYVDNMFVAIGKNGKTFNSDETGANWITQSENNISINDAAFDGIILSVAVSNGHIYCSDNFGENWSTTFDTGYNLLGVSYCNDRFIAVGSNGSIMYSTVPDESWTDVSMPDVTENLKSVTYGNGLYVITGESGNTYYSTDSKNWYKNPTVVSSSLNGIAYGDEAFVAVGNEGKGIVANY